MEVNTFLRRHGQQVEAEQARARRHRAVLARGLQFTVHGDLKQLRRARVDDQPLIVVEQAASEQLRAKVNVQRQRPQVIEPSRRSQFHAHALGQRTLDHHEQRALVVDHVVNALVLGARVRRLPSFGGLKRIQEIELADRRASFVGREEQRRVRARAREPLQLLRGLHPFDRHAVHVEDVDAIQCQDDELRQRRRPAHVDDGLVLPRVLLDHLEVAVDEADVRLAVHDEELLVAGDGMDAWTRVLDGGVDGRDRAELEPFG